MNDYADDPFKAMTRKYDAAVVRAGGRSIFSLVRDRRSLGRTPADGVRESERIGIPERWVPRPYGSAPDTEKHRQHGRPANIAKPGRIVGGLTGALGGWASDIDDREFGA